MLLYNYINTTSIGLCSLSESISVIVVAAEAVPILSQESNICVQFGRVQSWWCGGIGGREISLCPHVDLIIYGFLGSCSLGKYFTALYNG